MHAPGKVEFSSERSGATVLALRTRTSVWVALPVFSRVVRLLASVPLQEVNRRCIPVL